MNWGTYHLPRGVVQKTGEGNGSDTKEGDVKVRNDQPLVSISRQHQQKQTGRGTLAPESEHDFMQITMTSSRGQEPTLIYHGHSMDSILI